MTNKKSFTGFIRRAVVLVATGALVATAGVALSQDAWADGPRDSTRPARAAPAAKATSVQFMAKKPAFVGVVNINNATVAQLIRIPGIGPSKAKRIVAYRVRRGPFRRVRDLRRVKGIGRKTLMKMAKHLTVRGPTTVR